MLFCERMKALYQCRLMAIPDKAYRPQVFAMMGAALEIGLVKLETGKAVRIRMKQEEGEG